MTLNTKIEVLWTFWQFWAARRIFRANCAEINRGQAACIKSLALNIDFDNPSLDFLGSRKPAQCARRLQRAVPS